MYLYTLLETFLATEHPGMLQEPGVVWDVPGEQKGV